MEGPSRTWPENEERPVVQKTSPSSVNTLLASSAPLEGPPWWLQWYSLTLLLLSTCAWCLALSLLATRVCLLHHQGLSLVFTFSDMGTLPLLSAFEQVSRSNPALTLL